MQCFAVIIPVGSSLTGEEVAKVFEHHVQITDRVWFVASADHEEAVGIRDELSIGDTHDRSGVVAPLSSAVGFASATVVDKLNRWRES